MSFGLTPDCVRRITTPRPQSNKNLLPATPTRMAEPNRSALGKGVPVPSNVTRISSERAEAAMLSIMQSESNRAINRSEGPMFWKRSYVLVAASLCRGVLPVMLAATRRHSAVATTLAFHAIDFISCYRLHLAATVVSLALHYST